MKLALFGLLGLSMLKGCDLGDPQSVQPKMEDALRPYFPKVKAVALPQQQALVGLSCIENVGDEMVKMVAPAVASNPAMSQLKLLRFIPGSSYKIVAIGFEQGLAYYDVDTGNTGTIPQPQTYTTWYRQQCGIASSSAGNAYVWIGYFSAIVTDDEGHQKQTTIAQALGLYKDEEAFELHKARRLQLTENDMRTTYAERNLTLANLTFLRAEKSSVTIH